MGLNCILNKDAVTSRRGFLGLLVNGAIAFSGCSIPFFPDMGPKPKDTEHTSWDDMTYQGYWREILKEKYNRIALVDREIVARIKEYSGPDILEAFNVNILSRDPSIQIQVYREPSANSPKEGCFLLNFQHFLDNFNHIFRYKREDLKRADCRFNSNREASPIFIWKEKNDWCQVVWRKDYDNPKVIGKSYVKKIKGIQKGWIKRNKIAKTVEEFKSFLLREYRGAQLKLIQAARAQDPEKNFEYIYERYSKTLGIFPETDLMNNIVNSLEQKLNQSFDTVKTDIYYGLFGHRSPEVQKGTWGKYRLHINMNFSDNLKNKEHYTNQILPIVRKVLGSNFDASRAINPNSSSLTPFKLIKLSLKGKSNKYDLVKEIGEIIRR